ncbi:14-3-3-like protein D [Cyclospora cayetanensis]|uniref:14-3-3-like protein D n=1 Tax=Cyclospora cayetanensis TaxID=88456 RepID=A0A6P6RVJ8_9EIME|nr:14-3-3-like protein D [Cyclospora cayetanensis]
MKADYYRYLTEFAQDGNFDHVVQEALQAYDEASKIAEEGLPEGHPVRLGIALNFSVFHFEALSDPAKACELARAAIETPESAISALPEEQARDSESMLKLLQDNLSLWTGNVGEDEEADDEDTDN